MTTTAFNTAIDKAVAHTSNARVDELAVVVKQAFADVRVEVVAGMADTATRAKALNDFGNGLCDACATLASNLNGAT